MFKEGDIVRVKSGGPPMTVATIIRGSSRVSYNCSWFVGDDRRNENFSEGELILASPPVATNDGATSYDPLAGYR